MRTYFRILSYARPLGWYIPQYLVLILLTTVFSVVNFAVIIPLLRVLFDTADTQLVYEMPSFSMSVSYFQRLFYFYLTRLMETSGKINALYFICGIAVGSVFLANIFRYASQLIIARVRINVIRNLRNKLFERVIALDLNYFTETRKGDILSRITGDVSEVEQSVVSSLKALFREPFLILGYFIALFSMSVELTLYTLILIPVSGTLISILSKRLKQSARKSQETLGEINSTIDESLSGIRILKVFGATDYILKKFSRQIDRFARHTFRIAAKTNLASPTSEFLGVSVLTLLLLIGGTRVLQGNGSIDAAQFIGFLLIFAQVLNPAKSISAAISTVQRGIASGERIFELMDLEPAVRDRENAFEISNFEKEIQFDHVHFAYEENPVLEDLSFTLKKGQVMALVGPSGGGKSTIIDLILRFFDPISGRVTIDGLDIKELDSHSLRKLFGVVSQETILFNDTIANNIAFGMPETSQTEIEQAARIAHAHKFIMELKDGYQTRIGEKGDKLSGGQRQRISIARAVLKNPPILILDEATSSLDSESEKAVQLAMENLMNNRTVLIIAHRLSTIQHVDHILVVDQGKILEEGTHDHLIQSRGLYKKFSDMQSF